MATAPEELKTPQRARSLKLWLGSAAVGLIALAAAQGFQLLFPRYVQTLEGIVYDQGMTLHARRAAARSGGLPVVVVEWDESTRDPLLTDVAASFVPGVPGPLQFQQHQRAYHARVVENLTRLGARAIVFDVILDDSRPHLDAFLARAIRAHGNVILGAANDAGIAREGGVTVERTVSLQPPTAELRAAAAGYGVVNLPQDLDHTIRQFLWWTTGLDEDTAEDVEIPCLAVAAAAAFRGVPPMRVIQEEVKPRGTFLGHAIDWDWDPQFRTFVSYARYFGTAHAPAGEDSVIPYEQVFNLGRRVMDRDPDPNEEARLRRLVEGKLVLIGDAAQVGQDIHRVPVISRTAVLGDRQQIPGVEIQAHVVQTLLTGRYPRDASGAAQIALLLGACLLIALAGRVLSPLPLLGLALVAMIGLYWGSLELLAGPGVRLRPVTAAGGLGLALVGEITFMYFAERKDRLRARRQLSRHVGSGVAKKLTEDEWESLSGVSVEITLLFSDLQGFTTLSETMNSGELCDVLNRYFGGVIFPIVDRYGGSTDKLMGDGMMAYFGWPARYPDHAARAIRCALEMQAALGEWTRRPENSGLPPLRTRVGIHTGTATVGEIGSGSRAEFTVIGDVVNVASRLEGMNKEFDTTILVSDATRESAGEIVPMTPRGVATVRGRREPMPVYSIDPAAAPVDAGTAGDPVTGEKK